MISLICWDGPDSRVLAPWEERPRELLSWWDMLQFSAHAFFWCGAALRSISGDCAAGSAGVTPDGRVGFHMGNVLDAKARDKALAMLPSVVKQFRGIGLEITAETAEDVIKELNTENRYSFDWLHTQARSLEGLAEKELRNKLFLYIPPERTKFWPSQANPYPFGEAVARAFPSATFDINNAGICVGTTLATAAVFHLMRIMEIGLRALGAKFGVSLERTNWAPAIDQIESRIREMHKDAAWKALLDCKEQQEFYAQAASHFAILKDAWRNYTMHVRGSKYTEDEAERIFDNVRGFMQKLAMRLVEEATT
jgi:hypothetical protein